MRSVKRILLPIVIVLGGILAACAANPVASPEVGRSPEPAVAGTAKESWEVEWNKLVEEARKEGTVTLSTSNWSVDLQRALQQNFRRKFGIEIEFSGVGSGVEQVAKLERERIAGLYLIDVIGGGLNTSTTLLKPKGMLAPVEPLLVLPETRDMKVFVDGRLFLDAEKKYYVPLTANFDPLLARNTESVGERELTSFSDVLDQKWRGKMVMNDPTATGGGNAFVTLMGKVLGTEKSKEFLRQLVKQEPVINRDYRLQAEWLARGKVAVGIGVPIGQLMEFKNVGAPVAFVRAKEGGRVGGGPGGIALPSGKLPHPNAARVFINWILTREGGTVFSKAMSQPSWRLDVSTEGLEELVAPPGSIVDDEEAAQLNAQSRELAKEIFAPLLR
ncbi:MAG: extracellular solute-binding protein [Chloroflexi bacterium]|nr:extracellular solute-binding protein [Chloroflexota bacterium]